MPGYEYAFVKPVPKSLKCQLCYLPCRETVLISSCGHKFCESCINAYLSSGVFLCPEDKSSLDYAKIYPDAPTDTAILGLAVKCLHCNQGCEWTDQLHLLQHHLSGCLYEIISCPNSCSCKVPRQIIQHHLQFTCPKRKVNCRHCSECFTPETYESHCDSCPKEIMYCEKKCGEQLQRQAIPNHILNECPKRLLFCPYDCGKEFVCDTLSAHLTKCPRYPVACPNNCFLGLIPRVDLETHLLRICNPSMKTCPLLEVGCRYKGSQASIDHHVSDDQSQHLKLVLGAYLKQKNHIQILTSAVNHLQTNYDGKLLWKISNFSTKFAESKTREGYELQSPMFLTSKYGYKLQATMFLNGNGDGEGSHVSVYIKLLVGEYDALLSWPFLLPITFTLLDQSPDIDKRVHVKESFTPDAMCQSFHRPLKSCKSLGFGHARFVSHDTIKRRNFIREDVIFVKIEVDANCVCDV